MVEEEEANNMNKEVAEAEDMSKSSSVASSTVARASALSEAREHLLRAERNSRPTVTR